MFQADRAAHARCERLPEYLVVDGAAITRCRFVVQVMGDPTEKQGGVTHAGVDEAERRSLVLRAPAGHRLVIAVHALEVARQKAWLQP
jgi:hypothetical protein